MNYPSIRIEGAILSSDILERIEDLPGQKPTDFALDSSVKVKDEIARAWADAQDYWRIFRRKIEALRPDSPATTETRQQWVVPLLGLLGYQLEYQARGTEQNGKIYSISHRAANRAQAPVQIVGYREPSGLDRKPERSNLRMSAHGVVQEFLSLNEQLYGLVTNGRVLRLLRDNSRLIKLSYLEFDLDRIFTDGLFADFALLYRLLHASRLPVTNDTAAESLLERYHQDTIEQGTRIRDGLRAAVTEALEILGTGFVAHPQNCALREQIDAGELGYSAFFSHLLRLIYRLLFLNVVEERGLIFPKGTPATRLHTYSDYYSVQRLRRLARTRGLKTERHHDAWLSLLSTFELFERPEQATKLGVTAFGGQLFDPQSLGLLRSCRLSNAALFQALDRLCSFDDPKTRQRLPVNFGALATEEFGSVYESLLELHPVVETAPSRRFSFKEAAGNDRKTSGSYYTPTSLVDCLLDSALDPVLDDRIDNYAALGYPSVEAAILALKVCDPACGSGHFLIAAAQRIARRLAQIRVGDDEPSPDQQRHALREVISRCIYAVDINPMSVELCRVALWLEAVEPGKPLSFLDHHIRVGNSLVGATPELIAAGLPDKTFTAIEGDDKKACAVLKKRNKAEHAGLGPLFAEQDAEIQAHLQRTAAELEALPDDRPEEIRAKELAFRRHEETEEYYHKKRLADAWCTAFVIRKHFSELGREVSASGITQGHLNDLASGRPLPEALAAEAERVSRQYQFFHWHLAFPEVFAKDGFDCVLGNPPWERINLKEREWFAERRPDIATAATAAARKRLIEDLRTEDSALYAEFQGALRFAESESHFIRHSSLYPLCGRGDVNLYAVFAESMRARLTATGRAGCVLPSGIAIDDTTKFFFQDVVRTKSLASLFDFENKGIFFPGVHSSYKFCLFTVGRGLRPTADMAEFVFFAHSVEDIQSPDRRFRMSADDIALLNPNTRTTPIFRSRHDAELSLAITRRVGPLTLQPETRSDHWGFAYREVFHMAHDSSLFETSTSKMPRDGEAPRLLPLYEAKMIHHFDHRWMGFAGPDRDRDSEIDHRNASAFAMPRYWIPEDMLEARVRGDWKQMWRIGWRSISRTTDERTVIFAVIPKAGMSHSLPMALIESDFAWALPSVMSSFVADFGARQRLGGANVTMNILRQVPVLSPQQLSAHFAWSEGSPFLVTFLKPRVIELTYTAWDLERFATDCGWFCPPFRWDDGRRFLMRCELDAAFFHLYLPAEKSGDWHPAEGETTEDLAQLKASFPTPRDAVAYVMDTFPISRRKDQEKYNGDYRTKRVILEIYDDLADSIRTGRPYQTRLDPPPADPRCCHPSRGEGVDELLLVAGQ
jgi:hypothetical protein